MSEDPSNAMESPSTLTVVLMPGVDHMFNQGTLNIILDRVLGGQRASTPIHAPAIGLFTLMVRLTDKALREYDAARFELLDYVAHRDSDEAGSTLRTSPYIRAVDHLENVIVTIARAVVLMDRLRALGFGRSGPRITSAVRQDITNLRGMIEHGDERLIKESPKPNRPQFQPGEPYSLKLENTYAHLGNWKFDYADIVGVLESLYGAIETTRDAPTAGSNHRFAQTRTSVRTIGAEPPPPIPWRASPHLWEAARYAVSY